MLQTAVAVYAAAGVSPLALLGSKCVCTPLRSAGYTKVDVEEFSVR